MGFFGGDFCFVLLVSVVFFFFFFRFSQAAQGDTQSSQISQKDDKKKKKKPTIHPKTSARVALVEGVKEAIQVLMSKSLNPWIFESFDLNIDLVLILY